MVIREHDRPDDVLPSTWAPLRNKVFRALFIAQFVSNIGTWMQIVAAQWFLVETHSSDVTVALIQTASLGPTLVLGLFAGALADLFDRRRLLIVLQSYAVLMTLAMALMAYLGRLNPASLLTFTVAIGCASALTAPAWQAIQPEVVAREQIHAGATLASVSINVARAVGPAIGGVVVALVEPAAVFAINAVSFAGIIVALMSWRRSTEPASVEREHLNQAIISGLQYVRNGPIFRRILLRAALFLFPASALVALLPVAPRNGGSRGPAVMVSRWAPSGLAPSWPWLRRHRCTGGSRTTFCWRRARPSMPWLRRPWYGCHSPRRRRFWCCRGWRGWSP